MMKMAQPPSLPEKIGPYAYVANFVAVSGVWTMGREC